jgi:ribosomal protein S18 acetylase RimI-like enzyme
LADVIVRVAKADDRKRVLEFTHNTFSWGDYIERVFDRWFNDKSGRLLVAEAEGAVVGLSFVKLIKEGEVWLQGGRVDQKYRRMGVGEAMTRECLRMAKEDMNASVARVITDKMNLPPQKLLTKLGFKVVSEFSGFEKKAERVSDPELISDVALAGEELVSEMWHHIRSSPIFKEDGGLYTIWFVWYSLEEEDLTRFAQDGKVVVYSPGGKIHGVMLMDDSTPEARNERSIQASYLDADSDRGIKALASFLMNHAANKGLEKIRLWTCTDKKIIRSLSEIGFVEEIDESTEVVWMKELN